MKCYKRVLACTPIAMFVLGHSLLASAQKLDGGSERLMKSADIDFLLRTVQSAQAVEQLSQLDLQKSLSNGVKALARQFVDDHAQLETRLQAAAKEQYLTLPRTPNVKGQAFYYKLEHRSAAHFDRTYLKAVTRENQREAKACKREIKKGAVAAVKQLAEEELLAIQNHLQQLKSMPREAATGKS